MKIILVIFSSFIFLFSGTEKDKSIMPSVKAQQDCMEADYAQDVQSFYSKNPGSQKRNDAEIWENRVFVPALKHD
ncbi:hypothetical protein ACFLSQ_01585 [Bacteroidota bacterium]